ncbi:MAG: CHAT domain-containing protein, partial [Cyanobacteria bacterium P01_D01_bin.2]
MIFLLRIPSSLRRSLRWLLAPLVCLLIAAPAPALTQAPSLSQAIVNMELRLESEYETYFGEDLAEVTQTPEEIAATLARVGEETDTAPAVLWATPRPDHLHLVLITPNGEPIVR